MGNKSQTLSAKKQAKAKARQKKIKHQSAISRSTQQQHVASVLREQSKIKVSDRGVIGTAEYLKAVRKKVDSGDQEEITNKVVVEGIQEVIPKLLSIHAAVEVICELQKENKLTLSENDIKLIDQFDERIVKIGEDILTIQTFIEAGKKPEDYMAIFISYLDKLAMLFEKELEELFTTVMKPHETMVNEYVKEHTFEGESSFDFSMRYHTNRIDVVAEKYRTIAGLDLPEEPSEELKETNALNNTPVTC